MLRQFHICAAFSALILLSGCSTDALTPQANVPNVKNSAAADTQNSAAAQQASDIAGETQQPVDPGVDTAAGQRRAPQNTLEAQAQALQNGEENPALTRPDTANANPGDPSLSANLYKSNSDTKPASSIYSAASAAGTIRFLPIIGAPVQAVTPLSRELGNSARNNGLQIKGSSDQSAEHVLKGYLSAFSDGKNVTVVYVWDVLDNTGARLHRIQGQDSVPGSSSDAWSVVPPELMQSIGANTIAEYLKWRQSRG